MAHLKDDELKKTFAEGQAKLLDYSRQLSVVKTQIASKERERKIADVALKELNGMGDDVNMYKSVGKIFVMSDSSSLKSEFEGRIASYADDIKALETKSSWLDRNVSETHASLKEMLEKRV